MKWYRRLYLGEGLEEKRDRLIQKIECNAGVPRLYVMTLASNGHDLFDIFSANDLLQPVLHGLCPLIVGLFSSYDEAVETAAKIAQEAYRTTGSFAIAPYLESLMEDGQDMVYEYPMQKLKRRREYLIPELRRRLERAVNWLHGCRES